MRNKENNLIFEVYQEAGKEMPLEYLNKEALEIIGKLKGLGELLIQMDNTGQGSLLELNNYSDDQFIELRSLPSVLEEFAHSLNFIHSYGQSDSEDE